MSSQSEKDPSCPHLADFVSDPMTAENPMPDQRCADCGEVVITTVCIDVDEHRAIEMLAKATQVAPLKERHGG